MHSQCILDLLLDSYDVSLFYKQYLVYVKYFELSLVCCKIYIVDIECLHACKLRNQSQGPRLQGQRLAQAVFVTCHNKKENIQASSYLHRGYKGEDSGSGSLSE